MKDYRVYTIVALTLVGGLMLDILPDALTHIVDSRIGRSLGFLLVTVVGGVLGIPEAVLVATILGLIINRSHDMMTSHIPIDAATAGSGFEDHQDRPLPGKSRVLRDMTPTYTGSVAKRLGLVTLSTHRDIMDHDVSYRLR